MRKFYFKFLFFFLITIVGCYSVYSQSTQQRTFSTSVNFTTSLSIEIPGQGFIFATNVKVNFNTLTYTVISKINYNYDTVWVKKIDSLSLKTLNYDSTGNVIISGSYLLPTPGYPDFFSNVFCIIKINPNGYVLNSKCFNLFAQDLTSSDIFISNADLIVDHSNNIIFKDFSYQANAGGKYKSYLVKLNPSLNEIYAKKQLGFLGLSLPRPSFTYLMLHGKLHCFDNSGIYLTGSKKSANFYNIIQADTASRQLAKFDNFGMMVSNKMINESFNTIDNLIKTNSGLKICGNTNLYSYNQPNPNLLTRSFCIDFNSSVGSMYVRHNYSINYKKTNRSYFSFSKVNNKIFATQTSGNTFASVENNSTTNINDSNSNNARIRILKLNDDLSPNRLKRLHLFGTSIPAGIINQPFNYTTEFSNFLYPGLEFLHLSDRFNKITLAFNKSFFNFYNNYDDTLKRNTGVLFTSLDTSGLTANCNITSDVITDSVENVSIIDLPLISLTDTVLTVVNKNFTLLPYTFYSIKDTCLPLKKPRSRFIFTDNNSYGFTDVTCVNSSLTFYESAYNEPATWNWILPPEVNIPVIDSSDFPNLNNVRFTNSGIFPIKLVTQNGAGIDTLTKYITVINFIPQPNLGNDTLLCAGDSLKIIYTNPPNSLHNFFGNGIYTSSDTLKITQSGTYYIEAYTSCGYKYDTIVVNFAGRPTANFGIDNNCNSLSSSFTDSTVLNFNPALAYTYAYKPALASATAYTNFAATPNASFTFAAYDSFDVRLIVRSPLSCVQADTIVKRIVLKAKPTAACSFTNNCGSLAVSVTNGSSIAAGNISSYKYFAGNTLIASTPAFTYNFAAYGSYIIKQVVESNFGCVSDTFFLPVVVKDKPVNIISAIRDSVCINNSYTLTAAATVAASTINNYTWVRNDVLQSITGNQFTDNQPTGVYVYKAIATDANGCKSDTATKIITVVSKPTATLNATNLCGSKQINITTATNVINDNITNHYIDYGDGNTATSNPNNTTYSYANYGSYTLKYVAKSSVGCAADTAYFSIVVKDKPVATIAYSNNACQNTNFVLTATATVAASSIINYTWIRNSVILGTTTNPLTENLPAGNYLYKLVARAATGCSSDTVLQNVVVEQYPTTDFIAAGSCVGNNIIITNNSTSNNATGSLTFAWATNTGQVSTALVPTFTFSTSGTKTITLTTTTQNGCATTLSKNITVDDYPIAAFDITEACLGKPLAITNSSTGAISNYSWQVVNSGQASNEVVPNFTFNTEGDYSIKLVVATPNACSNTISKSTTIKAVRLFTTPASDTNVVINQPLQLNITGAATYLWSPGSNLNTAAGSGPVFISGTAGIYPLKIEGITAGGCKGNASLTVNVFAAGNYVWIPGAFTPNGDGLNDRLRITCSGLKLLKSFTVYNRYGQTVYRQTTCNDRGWDGKVKGILPPTGNFVYIWDGIDFNGKTVSGKGSVILVR